MDQEDPLKIQNLILEPKVEQETQTSFNNP